MNLDHQSSDFFTAGGTLPADAPSYVKRTTDDDLFRHIMNGDFCYVLTPRQMGKSSLMIRTEQRLKSEGVRSAIVDLTVTGTVESEDQWYKGILTQVKRRLRTSIDPVQWWEERKDIPNIQKFIEFFEEILTEVPERVVIFMDEIDTTLKLNFRDDFFAGIRAIFNDRARNPDLKRLTFVLLGVASPSDLIKDRNRTPFNIGQEIPLRSFSRENARMLEAGLEEAYPGFGKVILDRIFYWTNGHPYLTQKLCQSVVETPLKEYDEKEIDLLVKNLFTSEEASRETNLQFVRDNVLNYPERRVILSLYKKLLRGVEVRDNKNSLPQNHLKLSGLARTEDGKLVVSNKIYSKVFDQRWVNRYTEIDWRYFIIGALSLLVIGFASVFYNDGVRLPNQAATRVNGIPIYRDDRGIRYLADLYRMNPIIFVDEYKYEANDTFFNGFSSWEDQKALIEIAYGEPKPSLEDYETVVTGLYTSLADVDNSGQTTELLKVMRSSLKEMGLQDESLYKEITHWLEARKKAIDDPSGALEEYRQALQLNPQNPATLFERARIYARQGAFDIALKHYDQVLAIAPESDIEPTPVSTPTILVSTGSPSNTSPTSFALTGTPGIPLTTTSPVANATLAILTPASSNELTATAPLQPIQPRFLTLGQRVAAVNNDIEQNQELSSFLSKANLADYPNLEAKGLIPTVSPVTATIPPSTCDKVQFIADVNYPDGTVVAPGANFTRTWRLRNVGTCPWTTSYQLVFLSGEQMGAPASVAFTEDVNVGQTFDFSVNMIAPSTAGSYRGFWMFKNANGVLFGVGPQANKPWWVDINVSGPTVTPGRPTRTTQVQTTEVLGEIDKKYLALGGSTGFLGNPIGPETNTTDGNGRFREYQGGSIYWSRDTDAYEVHGEILDKWSSLGLESGFLGYPLTDETTTPDGIGRFNHFQGGSIYWSPETGAWEVHGFIREKWASLGWETSVLGYPLTDETTTPDGIGRFNHFQGGSIYWTPNTGAWEVHGYIRDRWAALGWERSCLGYPISDEEPATDSWERQSRFEHGIIQWSSSKGAVETCN